MDSRGLAIGVMFVIITALGMNFFLVDLYDSNSSSNPTLDTSKFDRTRDMTQSVQNIKDETGFLEDVPVVGDIVAIVGNSVRGMRFIFQIPGILITMIGEVAGIFGIPLWVTDAASAIIWIFVIFTILYFMRGARF